MEKSCIKPNPRPVIPKQQRPVIQPNERPDIKKPRAPVVLQPMPAEQALTFATLLLDEEVMKARDDEAAREWVREVLAARQALARLKAELSSPAELWPS